MLKWQVRASRFKLQPERYELKRRQAIEIAARLAARVAIEEMASHVPVWTGYAKASLRGNVIGFDGISHRAGSYFGGISNSQLVPIEKPPKIGLLKRVPWKEPWKNISNGEKAGHYNLSWSGKKTISFDFTSDAVNFGIGDQNGLPLYKCKAGKTRIWFQTAVRSGTGRKWHATDRAEVVFRDRLKRELNKTRLVLGDFIIKESNTKWQI